MGNVMQGISEDVKFNHEHADALINACNDAADTIEGQTSSRSSWLNDALTDFKGYYADIFKRNGEIQVSDASLVVTRLREVVKAVQDLKAAAKAEQERRETARAWKQRQDERGFWDHVADWFTGGEAPPVGPPNPEPTFSVTAVSPPERQAITGSGYTGTSSARPANLRSFATNSSGGNNELRPKATTASTAYSNFEGSCHWGSLSASGVFTGFDKYITANDNDVTWANTVADAFEAAGGNGVVTVANATVTAALETAGVNAERKDLEIDPPQMFGAPPTTGYANDPVNTATGNFLEPEMDLGFDGGCSALVWGRMYNSVNPAVGAFGPGWSSWTEAGLVVGDSEARWRLFDGREIVFPRLGKGWDRATSEAFWLSPVEDGWEICDNTGGWWRFDTAGRLTGFAAGEGFQVMLTWSEGRLERMAHERGRWVDVVWDEGGAARVVAALASDGRRIDYSYDDVGRLVAVADSSGGVRRYVWDEAGLLARVIDADGVVEVTNSYDPRGRVVEQISQHGRVSRFTYLPGHVTVVADEDGSRSNTWIHDARGRLTRIVDADGEATSFARDQFGNILLGTERDGGVTASQYDDRSRLIARVTPTGARIENLWDEQDRLLQVRVFTDDGDPSVTTYDYDTGSRYPSQIIDGTGAVTRLAWERGLLVSMTDPTGVEFHIRYDQYGDIIAMVDGAGNTSRLERDETGKIVASITPNGHVTRFEWVGDRLAARVDPDGGRWGFEHTPAGRLTATIDPLGARTEITHDTAGEVATVTDPLDRTTQSFHDDLGHLAATVLPDGRRWEYTHDALSRLVAVTDPEGARWEYTHDVMGQVVSQVDPTGRSWTTGYSKDRTEIWQHPDIPHPPTTTQVTDRIGRVVSTTNPHGGTHHTRYDRCGRPVEHIDPDGGVTVLTRDPAGRVLQIHHPDDSVTTYGYDPVTGRLVSVTDALGHTTVFVTDADNRLVAEIDPAGGENRYSYDPCGRVVEVRHPVHGRSTWRYDPCGRVVKTWSRFLGARHFHYNSVGQLVEAVDALGRVTRYSYDTGGRATTITDPLGNTTRREFNHLDLNTAETDPLGRTKHHTYDPAGRLTGHERASGERLEWRHDGAGQVHEVVVNGLVVATHRRDHAANLLTVEDVTDPDAPVTHRLRWDTSGRLVEQTRNDAVTRWEYDLLGRCVRETAPNGQSSGYGYDPLGRCTHIDTPAGKITQVFDPAGRLVESHSPDSTQTWDYTNGQVTGHHIEAPDGTHDTVITRDDDGRITAITRDGETTSYRHDAAGQLIETRDPHGRVCTWTYDQAGRLVEEIDGEELIRYIHDAAGQLLEHHQGTDITRYTYNADGKRISEEGPSGRIDYTWSALGWLTHITGPHGATSLHVNALGELARVNNADLYWNTTSQPIQINDQAITTTWAGTAIGHQWLPTGWRTGRATSSNPWDTPDATTISIDGIAITPDGGLHIAGLEWLTHRVYQPDTRSFLTPDPLPPTTGTAFTGNPYHYTNNNPLHAQDPLGLQPVTDEELAEYTHRHHTGSFWERNGTAVIGAGITIAGAIITFTPIPGAQIIGGVLFSGGMSIASQGFQNPGQPPDMIQVGINAAVGAIGGGITTGLLAFGGRAVNVARSIWFQAGLGAGLGGAGGAAEGAYLASKAGLTGDAYWENVKTSAFSGAVLGAVSSAALAGASKGGNWMKARGDSSTTTPSNSVADMPTPASADVKPSPSSPTLPTGGSPRRALPEFEGPRRSSGEVAPVPGIPRRAMLDPQPRRAVSESVFGDSP